MRPLLFEADESSLILTREATPAQTSVGILASLNPILSLAIVVDSKEIYGLVNDVGLC